jgi:hypothetical protein
MVGVTETVREQLLEGLPALVQGMADHALLEWADAVDAVPALAALASEDIVGLLRMDPAERESCLRRRWAAQAATISLIGRAAWIPSLSRPSPAMG